MTTPTKQSLQLSPPNKYRSFIFVLHETYGMLLLHCTRKVKKGYHYQIPGGHVDDEDFSTIVTTNLNINNNNENDTTMIRQMAGMVGAVRELYEETGIDLRNTIVLPQQQQQQQQQQIFDHTLTRIHPLPLYDSTEIDDGDGISINNGNDGTSPKYSKLINEYKHRLFYTVIVIDNDLMVNATVATDHHPPNTTLNHNNTNVPNQDSNSYSNYYNNNNNNTSRHLPLPPSHIRLKLSHEHSGYTFVKDIHTIYSMIGLHSGGAIAEAFRMTCTVKAKNTNVNDPWTTTLYSSITNSNEPFVSLTRNINLNDGIGENKEHEDENDDDDDE